MSSVQAYLDCGCAIMKDGSRSFCPSCSSPPAPVDPITELRQELLEKTRRVAYLEGVSESQSNMLRDCFDKVSDLEEEIEVLRLYGNNDCTAQADEALATRRANPARKRK